MKGGQRRRLLGFLIALIMVVAMMNGTVVNAMELEQQQLAEANSLLKIKVIAVDDFASTNPGKTIAINVLANDSVTGGIGLSLKVTHVSSPSHGSARISSDSKSIVYTANSTYKGKVYLQYKATAYFLGAKVASDTATVTIDVQPVNNPPQATPETILNDMDKPVSIDLLNLCSDKDGDELTFRIDQGPSHGSVVLNGSVATYTPNQGYVGNDSFTYIVSDGKAEAEATIVIVMLEPPVTNQPPVTGDISVETTMNESITIDALKYCSDPDADPLTLVSVSNPSHGEANIEEGKVVYCPETGFTGEDQFEYTISDGIATATGAITVKVSAPTVPEYKPLRPVLEFVEYYGQLETGEHAWEAHWGWLNENDFDVEPLVCKFTGTVVGPDNFPSTFAPGRQYNQFSTIFTSTHLVWTLMGPDGTQRTATAARTDIPDPAPTSGTLTIKKQIMGDGNPDDLFEIAIIPEGATLYCVHEPIFISVNQPWTGELEPGTYRVVEVNMPDGYFLYEISCDYVTIEAGGEYVVTIFNRYEAPQPEQGTLIIRKQITGTGYNPNARFQVVIEPYGNFAAESMSEARVAYISVNEPWEGQLDPGFYRVREVEMPSSRYSLVRITNEGIVEVRAGDTTEIVVTNRYQPPVIPPDPDPEPPQQPEEPVEPEIPEEPTEPEVPEEPEEPVEPEEPEVPEQPVEPEEPEEPTEPDIPVLPQTGAIDGALVLGTILTLSGLWLSRKRK